MGDRMENDNALIVRPEFEDLRSRIAVPDTKSKTRKWLQMQIQERRGAIESFKGQIAALEGMIEHKAEELEELERRLKLLEGLNE